MNSKGITLVMLVITLVVLTILTGAIVTTTMGEQGVFWELQEGMKEEQRDTLIKNISNQIRAEKLKESISNNNFTIQGDVLPMLQQFGTYDNNTLKLTTDDGFEIWLYEVMEIPVLEYITATYIGEVMTVTDNALSGYIVQYSINNGNTWITYSQPVTTAQTIHLRITTSTGVVISNVEQVN